MTAVHPSRDRDRRALPRLAGGPLAVKLRVQGRLLGLRGVIADFNRDGIGVVVTEPIAERRRVLLSLAYDGIVVRDAIGIVHNCCQSRTGPREYRVGIRFRTTSANQFDRAAVEHGLLALEARLCTPTS